MKKGILVFSVAVATVFAMRPVAMATGEGWTDNFAEAKAQAAAEGKDILMDFTGSDWCGWCIKLDNEVFKQDAFKASAPKDFVLVVLDFPKDKSLVSEAAAKQNEQLKTEFAIPGFPTLFLTDATGRPYAQAKYMEGGPENYLTYLAGLKAIGQTRNAKLAAADTATDPLEKARLIDAALEAVGPELAGRFYAKEIRQIQILDAENLAGLKQKYFQQGLEKTLGELLEEEKFDDAAAAAKEALADWELPEAETAELVRMYDRMIFEGRLDFLLRDGKCDEATALMEECLADWKLTEGETVELRNQYEYKIFEGRYWSMIYQERFAEAIASIERWIDTQKPEGEALLTLRLKIASILGMKGDFDESIEMAEGLIKEQDLKGDELQQALLVKYHAFRIQEDIESKIIILEEIIAAAPESDRSEYFREELDRQKKKPVPKKKNNLPSLDRFTETLPAPVVNDRQTIDRFSKEFGAIVDAGEATPCSELMEAFGDSEEARIAPARVAQAAAEGQPKSPAALYRDHMDSVLMFANVFKCGKCDNWHPGSGATAWVWGEKGILVTNYHLVGGEDKNHCVAVMTRDGRIFPVVEILAVDKAADIAVIRVDLGDETLVPLALGPSPEIGDDVVVLSNPKQRLFSFTKGYVSRYFTRPDNYGAGMITLMTITADYASGSSGGPILDDHGRVVGMVSSTVSARASKKGPDGKPEMGDVQMVFKDSVPVAAIRALLESE